MEAASGRICETRADSTKKGSDYLMGIERLEVELKNLSERVRKLEAWTASTVGNSPKSRSPEVREHPRLAESPAIQNQTSNSAAIDTIEFHSVEHFERDLEELDALEKQIVINAINTKSPLWLNDRSKADKEFLRPYRFWLPGGLESSVCELRVGTDRTVIMAVDDDPIFGRVIVTLLRIVSKCARRTAYEELASLLYPGQTLEVQTTERE